eukprot:s1887_g8.t1
MQDEFGVLVEACCVGIGLAHFWYKIPNLLRHSVDERRFRRVRSIQSRFLIPHRLLWDCIDVFNQADRSRLSGVLTAIAGLFTFRSSTAGDVLRLAQLNGHWFRRAYRAANLFGYFLLPWWHGLRELDARHFRELAMAFATGGACLMLVFMALRGGTSWGQDRRCWTCLEA